jgi:hypothetical protein
MLSLVALNWGVLQLLQWTQSRARERDLGGLHIILWAEVLE